MISIYALRDPHTQQIRYVGKANNVTRRMYAHLEGAAKGEVTHKARWIRTLDGIPPLVEILEVVEGDWRESERRWIAEMRSRGEPLTNETEGGEGLHEPSAEVRKRMGEAIRRGMTPEVRAKISAMQCGKLRGPRSDEVRAKISAGLLGKVHSRESIERTRLANTGKKMAPRWPEWRVNQGRAIRIALAKRRVAAVVAHGQMEFPA